MELVSCPYISWLLNNDKAAAVPTVGSILPMYQGRQRYILRLLLRSHYILGVICHTIWLVRQIYCYTKGILTLILRRRHRWHAGSWLWSIVGVLLWYCVARSFGSPLCYYLSTQVMIWYRHRLPPIMTDVDIVRYCMYATQITSILLDVTAPRLSPRQGLTEEPSRDLASIILAMDINLVRTTPGLQSHWPYLEQRVGITLDQYISFRSMNRLTSALGH